MLLFLCFFQLYSTKNNENYYFNQRLGCAAPKRWLKYTTPPHKEGREQAPHEAQEPNRQIKKLLLIQICGCYPVIRNVEKIGLSKPQIIFLETNKCFS